MINRIFTSLTKKWWQSLILIALVFVLGTIIAGSKVIYDSTKNLETTMKQQLGAYVGIDYGPSDMSAQPDAKAMFDSKKAEVLGKRPEVSSHTYSSDRSGGSKTLKSVETSNSIGMNDKGDKDFEFQISGTKGGIPNKATTGEIKLKEGSFPKDKEKNTIAISEELAKKNNLKLGDVATYYFPVITVDESARDLTVLERMKVEAKIVGIYEVSKSSSSNQTQTFINELLQNTLFVSIDNVNEFDAKRQEVELAETGTSFPDEVFPIYTLKSVDDIDSFVKAAEKAVGDRYKVNTSLDSYAAIAGSIKSMNTLSNQVLWFSIGASLIILSLMLILFIRERKIEFGIYQALGESKLKTGLQILFEMIIIAIIGIGLSFLSSQAIAKKVGDDLLKTQISQINNSSGMENTMDMTPAPTLPTISADDISENFVVTFDSEQIFFFIFAMIGCVVIASSITMIYILKNKPREILL